MRWRARLRWGVHVQYLPGPTHAHTHTHTQHTTPTRAGLLEAANSSGASYLFQPDKLHGNMDIGDKSLQCGRKSDSLKIW